jgi:hypothetical protein
MANQQWLQTNEQQFQQWYADRARRYNLNPNPDDPRQRYDYRAAFRAGAEPDPKTGHWPSAFKREGHQNIVVGGFQTQNGARQPGTVQANAAELMRMGWGPEAAVRLSPSGSGIGPVAGHTQLPAVPATWGAYLGLLGR